MKSFFALALTAAAAVVSAQEVKTHIVQVGLDDTGTPGPRFSPSAIKANVGDQVSFQFRAKNHTVTQSSFAQPCTRQFNTATQELGVDSGFQPVAPDATEIPVWTIQIDNAAAPLWFFCNFKAGDASHCNAGMVFSINAQDEGQGERTHAKFLETAATAEHPPPEASVSADFTPPAPTGGAPAPGPAPSGELSTSPLVPGAESTPPAGGNPPAGETPGPDGTNSAPNANNTAPVGAGSPAFAVKVSGAGVAASLIALVAALAL